MATGRIYDVAETQTMIDLLKEQEKGFKVTDTETKVATNSVLQYAIIGGASIVFLVLLKFLIKKKK
jgi:hypothetical protein